MKALLVSSIATALLALLTLALAHLAVEVNAAGALLSPGGLVDPIAGLAGGGYALLRLASFASCCVTFALFWAWIASLATSKRA